MRPQELRARSDEILQLHEDGDLERALAACADLLVDAEQLETTDPVVRETLFAARFERALLLTELGDLDAAASAYAEAARTPADPTDPDQRHELAMASLNRGICADAAGDADEALRAYDELIDRFGDADDPVTRDQVVRGRVNRAASLLTLGRLEDSIAAARDVAGGLDPRDALEAEQYAMAMRLSAAGLQAMDRSDEAAEALRAVDRCNDEDPATRSQVAAARRELAELLAGTGGLEPAIDLLESTVERFRDDPDPVVVDVVADLVDAEVALLTRAGQEQRAADVRARNEADG